MHESTQQAAASVERGRRLSPTDWVGLGILILLLGVGLTWSKWLPYWDKAWTLSETSIWDGAPLFDVAGDAMSLSGAWDFTLAYFLAVWKALLVALLVAAAIDALVPRDWLLRVMNRRHAATQSLVGATLSMPSMMCTCCAAPVAAGLRSSGVTRSAALAYWVGNPCSTPQCSSSSPSSCRGSTSARASSSVCSSPSGRVRSSGPGCRDASGTFPQRNRAHPHA